MKMYFLRNTLTELYFNGTDFSAATIRDAKPFTEEPVNARLIWSNSAVECWQFPYSSAMRLATPTARALAAMAAAISR